MKKMWKGGVLFVLCVLCLYTANEAKATSKTSDEAINWVKSQVGNSIDADGAYGAQCVDLIRAYYNFLGVAQVRGNGCDYATDKDKGSTAAKRRYFGVYRWVWSCSNI